MAEVRDQSRSRLFVSLAVAAGAVALATVLSIPLKDLMPHSRGLLLFVAIMFSAWYGGMWPGILASALAAKSFSYFLNGQRGIDLSLENGARVVVFGAAALLVTYLTATRKQALADAKALNEQLAKALEENRVLRGILPICMHCKQIRDDEGGWQEIERYVSERTDARFSHGVCPDCLTEFYPDVYPKAAANSGD